MTTAEHVLKRLSIDDIRPYPNNPRTWYESDVERVAASIRSYGYQAPIIVNQDHVIVVGHLRYAALRSLGVSEVTVLVTDLSPEKEAEYRIIDNRAGELVSWDRDLLIPELREFADASAVALFFPDIDLSMDFSAESFLLDENDIAEAQAVLDKRMRDRVAKTRAVICPHCGHHFVVSA